jgi:hypothetical protein
MPIFNESNLIGHIMMLPNIFNVVVLCLALCLALYVARITRKQTKLVAVTA